MGALNRGGIKISRKHLLNHFTRDSDDFEFCFVQQSLLKT